MNAGDGEIKQLAVRRDGIPSVRRDAACDGGWCWCDHRIESSPVRDVGPGNRRHRSSWRHAAAMVATTVVWRAEADNGPAWHWP